MSAPVMPFVEHDRPQRARRAALRLLCVDQYAHIGGGQRSLLDLLPSFVEHGWEPVIATPGQGRFADALDEHGYPTFDLPFGTYSSTKKPPSQIIRFAWELPNIKNSLKRIVDRTGADLLYVNGPRVLPPAAWIARQTGIPLVFHCHNRLFQNSAITLAGNSLKFARARMIACCNYAAAPLKRYLPSEHLSIVFNGVGRVPNRRPRALTHHARIGIVGRIEKEKGHAEFVEAARIVSSKYPQCRFVIAGSPMFSGTEYYSQIVAASKGLPVEFLDWQNDPAKIYSTLDLLVVPSSYLEATTRVILEAYSCGLPVVAFPCGGIPEVMKDNETGFLTSTPTAKSLAARIIDVLNLDSEQLAKTSRMAEEEWAAKYTVERYRDSVCAILGRAAGGVEVALKQGEWHDRVQHR